MKKSILRLARTITCGLPLLLCVWGCAGPPAERAPEPAAAASPSPTPSPGEMKTLVETQKLAEELKALAATNSALDARFRWVTVWISALGSIFIAILVGIFFNRTQNQKLAQDKRLGREEHLLKVFHDLGEAEPRVRIGAVSVLIQRLSDLRSQAGRRGQKRRRRADPEEQKEFPTIVRVLISVTRHEKSVDIQKAIADGVAKSLGALIDPDEELRGKVPPPTSLRSPLRAYDLQGARFQKAWWYSVDARGVDFYEADLRNAGLREAYLTEAVLVRAKLDGASLVKAHLDKANLEEASLSGAVLKEAWLTYANLKQANLQGANLTGAKLEGADLCGADLTGARLEGADLRKAKLTRANIKGARFGQSNLTGADLTGAVRDEGTDFSGAINEPTGEAQDAKRQ